MKNFKIIISLVALLTASNAKPMTGAERRAARRSGAAAMNTAPVEVVSARPMTGAERRAARRNVMAITQTAPIEVVVAKPVERRRRAAREQVTEVINTAPVEVVATRPLTGAERRAARRNVTTVTQTAPIEVSEPVERRRAARTQVTEVINTAPVEAVTARPLTGAERRAARRNVTVVTQTAPIEVVAARPLTDTERRAARIQVAAVTKEVMEPYRPNIIVQEQLGMHLVSTDARTLGQYDLCPLFSKNLLVLNKDEQALAKELRAQGFSEEQLAQYFGKVAPHYSVFNEKYKSESGAVRATFENKNVNADVPCVVQLGMFGAWNRRLMQLKSLDQFEFAEKTGFSAAMCGGLSLNSGRLMREYALTGSKERLEDLHDMAVAASFLENLKIGDWLNASVVRQNIARLGQELGVDGIDVSAIETISLFDPELNKKQWFGLFDADEFNYVQNVKKNIQQGLKRDNYVHIMIVGNEETVENALGHYFCFVIIKAGNEIQYVVLDTVPSTYHLQAGSHERERLMFVIENIERGNSLIKVANIRVKQWQMLK